MGISDFSKNSLREIQRNGAEGVADVSYKLYRIWWDRVSRIDRSGVNIYERDWDILLILDGCRYDAFSKLISEENFDGFRHTDVEKIRSVGSNSEEWLEKTFTSSYQKEINKTTYIVGNPFSEQYLDSNEFQELKEIWKYSWDNDIGTIRAEGLTDSAITHWRDSSPAKMIVHYMQPHFPCVPDPKFNSGIELDRIGESWESVWDLLRKKKVEKNEVYDSYLKNLKYILSNISILLCSINAEKVVITADHGNTFGRWGLYGHPRAPISDIRNVPWYEVSANATSDYEPTNVLEEKDIEQKSIENKLRDLGYL